MRLTLGLLLWALGTLLLLTATFVALGDVSTGREAALIPAGLACWCASSRIP